MKYADGLWLNKPGYGVNYATQMYEVTADETSINVLATNQWIGNRGMTLGGPVLEITFTSTLENTIKVYISLPISSSTRTRASDPSSRRPTAHTSLFPAILR